MYTFYWFCRQKLIKFIYDFNQINLFMRKKQKNQQFHQSNELQISFVKQNKQLSQQQNRLNVQILRVHTIEKQRMVQQIFNMSQQGLCQYFSLYEIFPYNNSINIKQLLQSVNLKLIKNQDKIYFGQVQKKRRIGKGINITKDGKIFEGQFVNNQKFGLGVEIYANGNLYLGQFQNSKKHGHGQFFWFHLSSKNPKEDEYVQHYDGQWWGGLPDGQGVHQKINGDLYTGNFKNGLKHGQGAQYFANGDIYKGQYINGLPQGYGQYNWNDKSYYKGDFKQGLRNGYGVWGLGEHLQQKYKGHYCMDKKSGYGVYEWQNGWIYKGNFDNDLRNGFGQLYDGNKLVYRGFWKNGQQTDQQIKNQKGFEQTNSKTFNQSTSLIYNRKVGNSAQRLNKYQDYGINFNPQSRNQSLRKNKSATKRRQQQNNYGDFGPISYKDEFVIKKRPQSFNTSNKGGMTRRTTITQKKTSRPSNNRYSQSHRQNRTNFSSNQKGRTIDFNNNNFGGGSTIGSSISRPLMKNPNMGSLYIPYHKESRDLRFN